MNTTHRFIKPLVVLGGLMVVLTSVAALCIFLSGFLSASTDAKRVLVYGELRSIRRVISDYWCTGGHVLPTDWSSLEVAERVPHPMQVKDPFSDGAAEFLSQFSEKRIIVWSVGPDSIDDLDTSREEVNGKDELVLVVNYTDGRLETKVLDFSLGEGVAPLVPGFSSTIGPESCN